MRWRFWLVDGPARLLDLWFRFYWTLLTVLCAGLFLTLVISLVLDQWGIRWGW